ASQRNLDVEIASAGPIFGMGLAFRNIVVATRPTDGSRPTRFRIAAARVSLSPVARLFGEDALGVSADTLGGDVDINWEANKAKTRLKMKSEDLAIADVPGVKEAINLPLGSKLGLSL